MMEGAEKISPFPASSRDNYTKSTENSLLRHRKEHSSKDQSQKSKNSVCYWFVDTDLSTMFWLEDHLSTSKNLSWGKDIFTNRLWCDLSRLFSQTLKSLKSRIFLILSIWYIPWKHIWFWVLFVTKGQLRKRWWISWLYVRDKNVGSVGVWIYDWRVVDLAISYHTQLRKPLLISCRPLAWLYTYYK